jgi:peptidoglycan/LPS O-acetylase OafA/YrhL
MLDKIGPGYFRYFLCFVVVLFHSTNLVAIGEWSVHVFFILSGYWVTKMFKEKYKDFKHPVSSFYASRILRLLPVFYVNILLFILVNSLVRNITPWEYIKPIVMNVGTLFAHTCILGLSVFGRLIPPSWSLDIEVQFYLLIPLLVWISTKLSLRIFIITGSILFVFTSFIYLIHDSWHLFPSVLNYFCFFIAGMWLYYSSYYSSVKIANIFVVVALLLLLITYIHPLLFKEVVMQNSLRINGVLFRVIFDYVLALLMIPFISRNIRNKSSRLDKEFANLSYITYLFHWVVIYPWGHYYDHLPFWERMPSFIGFLCVTVAGSFIIYYLIDVPFERLRKKWVA